MDPSSLPDLVRLADHGGDWHRYVETIYQHFRQDFVVSKPAYPGKRFALKRHPVVDGKEATFWHITSEGNVEADRLPNLRRCERIRWPRLMIEAVADDGVKHWENQRKGKTRHLLALDDFSYVVVLADRGEYILLWTAFYVEVDRRRKKLELEYEAQKC